MAAERAFRAMGTTARLVVTDGDEAMLDRAQARIDELESRWSRFQPDSELSRLNAASGRTALVSRETYDLVQRAIDAWFLTEGRFDPTVLPALAANGYDRSFDRIDAPINASQTRPRPAPGCAEIRLGVAVTSVTLPPGVQLDLGGIGKGYAADLVFQELMQRGASGALVSIGGDLRCGGDPPWEEGWLVEVEDPFDPAHTLLTLRLREGAVVTTSRTKRTWMRDGLTAHHIIDPATGRPADSGLASVTVLAGEAWWAEVFAKAAFLAGPVDGPKLLARADTTGILVDDMGVVHRLNRLAPYTVG